MSRGKVYLVGAGPGDYELLTLKAKRLIESADVIFYDALVGISILAKIPEDKQTVHVGKRAGEHSATQEEINELILRYALEGKQVVRLKGGDPFLFGRGGEELELLVEHEVEYEIIPGITSAIAVPAYQGIPVTHRDFCSSVHIITGHKKKGTALGLAFDTLVKVEGTLVFLMGISSLTYICKGLLEHGMDSNTPAAVLQRGTTAKQKRLVATLSTLEEVVAKTKIETPAIIVVGEVCKLANTFAWYDSMPLANTRVLLTRPKELISKTSQLLREKGAEVLEIPAIATNTISENSKLKVALEDLSRYDWLVFTSIIGVEVFFAQLQKYGYDIRRLAHLKIAAIGQGTTKALSQKGINADFMPSQYDGETLAKELVDKCQSGDHILIPRAKEGNTTLTEILEEKGLIVEDIATYETTYKTSKIISIKEQLENNQIDIVVFTSASTVKGFEQITKGMDYSCVKAACIGKQTKAYADSLGMNTYMARKATIEDLITLVEEIANNK